MIELARELTAVLLIAVNVAMWIASVERRAGRTIPEVHHWTEME